MYVYGKSIPNLKNLPKGSRRRHEKHVIEVINNIHTGISLKGVEGFLNLEHRVPTLGLALPKNLPKGSRRKVFISSREMYLISTS